MFFGSENEDPDEHISNITDIIDLFHSPGVSRDHVMLMAFPFTLKGRQTNAIRNFEQESNEPLHLAWERFNDSLYNCPKHKINEREQLLIFYQGLDTKTRRKVDFKRPIPRMTPAAEIEAIIELPKHSLSWYEEGDFKNKNLNVVFKQINNFEQNMNDITEEVRMAQHKYKLLDKGGISKLEETLSSFIEESHRNQKENENLSLLSFTETNPRGLAHTITTRSGLNYNPPKNPLEETNDTQNKTTEKISTKNEQLSINIPFIEALEQMPKYAKFMKDLLTQRGRGQSGTNKALADLGASISLMPYSMFLRLNLGELKPTRMCIKLANKSTKIPKGIAENVIVKIDRFVFPVDFIVLDIKEDHNIPIILGRPFLATSHVMIDVFNNKISFEVGNETITFELEKSMRFPPSDDDTCHSVYIIDLSDLDHVQEILPSEPFDSILFDLINHLLPTKINSLWDDNEGEQDLINKISGDLEPGSKDYTKPTLFAANMFEGEKPTTKLKDLPSYLEYAFLDNNKEFLVIISSLLSSHKKELLLVVLTKHKNALAWKVADIKGISPSFCTHKILIEDNFKPVVQPQRRLNPKVQDVVKAKIVKLLDAGLICAISDTLWVSPIHMVPKKGGITVVTNIDNELVPTRTITGWRDFMEVFMDDFSVFGNSFNSCLNNLSKMLARIVLGHKISKAEIEVDKAKVDVITKLPYPTNIKGIRSFLGHAGFYRRFIKDFSKIARPMTQLPMKDIEFVFSNECIKSFDILRNKLTIALVIIASNWNLDFELMCDASDYAVGAILGQRVDKKFRLIYYVSKTMNDAQEHYTTTEKELLAVVYAFDKFRLENPELEELDEDAIRDSFLDEHLMVINIKEVETDPWPNSCLHAQIILEQLEVLNHVIQLIQNPIQRAITELVYLSLPHYLLLIIPIFVDYGSWLGNYGVIFFEKKIRCIPVQFSEVELRLIALNSELQVFHPFFDNNVPDPHVDCVEQVNFVRSK
ncbi:reverse transcriptase domain-containing protein [Tanacetum coccineum]|uniref:Reverse transcriptase domain-containing protein n=1 Tax=Tanacetum coccineum TaxID=301880 RepID=A0ABQ4Z4Z5_9ASTR